MILCWFNSTRDFLKRLIVLQKNYNHIIILFFTPFLFFAQQKEIKLESPDKNILFLFDMNQKSPFYSVSFKNEGIIKNSELSLDFKDSGHFGSNLKIKNVIYKNINERYSLIVGKVKTAQNHYSEAKMTLAEEKSPFREINLIVRCYNDAVAFRYEFPKQKAWKKYEMTAENSTFNFVENPMVYTLFRKNYTTSHEGLYTKIKLEAVKKDTLMDMPTLFELKNSYVSITEAELRDYAGMYLSKIDNHKLVSKLSPLPNQTDIKVKAVLPHQSPWRVIMISDKIGGLIESNILTDLCSPSKIKDWSWLKSGKTTFTWWNGDVLKDVDFEVGLNYETHKHYIDFCAANNIDFHSVVSYKDCAWYQGQVGDFGVPSPNADVTKPVESLQWDKLVAYSKEKGIGLRVWVNWKSLAPKLDEAFAFYEKSNIKGLMIDFMDRDDQEMVNWMEKVLQTAAKYHLHIQFHGTFKPTGLQRMYPNELTREASLNLEVSKWDSTVDPEHNVMVPFTRMLAGPMDYHEGGFRSITRDKFDPAKTPEPFVLGTRCHHLAMPIVYESELQMICDYPEAYKNQLGFELLTQLPTTWDEVKVLNAKIGDYLTIARKKDNDWYVGTMNDWTPRKLEIKLDFLPKGIFLADVYEDAKDSDVEPNHLTKKTIEVTNQSILTANLASGGGQAVWIRTKK
jgi:alpha-glucosidase